MVAIRKWCVFVLFYEDVNRGYVGLAEKVLSSQNPVREVAFQSYRDRYRRYKSLLNRRANNIVYFHKYIVVRMRNRLFWNSRPDFLKAWLELFTTLEFAQHYVEIISDTLTRIGYVPWSIKDIEGVWGECFFVF